MSRVVDRRTPPPPGSGTSGSPSFLSNADFQMVDAPQEIADSAALGLHTILFDEGNTTESDDVTIGSALGDVVIGTTGLYEVYGEVDFAPDANGERRIVVVSLSGQKLYIDRTVPASAAGGDQVVVIPRTLLFLPASGMPLNLNVAQSSGGALDVTYAELAFQRVL